MNNTKDQKKILIIVENLPVPHDKRVWQEAESLTKAGYKVAVISPKGKGYNKKYEVINNVSIYRHPLPIEARGALGYLIEYPIALFWEFFLSIKVLFQHGFDVIHACNPPDTIFLIGVFFKVFRKKFLFDHHDGNPEVWIAKGGSKGLIYRLLVIFEKLSFWSADVSLSVNNHYHNVAITRGGVKPENVFIVRNAPNFKMREKNPGNYNKTKKNKEGKYIIGYLGVMGKQDGVDNLLYIIDELVNKKNIENVIFKIMGDGPELKYLKLLSSELGIEKYTEFTGWVSGDDYFSNLASCDICVNADTYNGYNEYCSPNKVYEYMFFGKPIIQFDLPESKFVSGDSSLYAEKNNNSEFSDLIINLINNPEKRKLMGSIGKKRLFEKFTWEKSEEQLLKAYKYVLKKKVLKYN